MDETGRLLIVVGLATVALGVVFLLAGHVPWLGRLPGDIHVETERVRFSFPLATSLLISLVLTIVLNLLARR